MSLTPILQKEQELLNRRDELLEKLTRKYFEKPKPTFSNDNLIVVANRLPVSISRTDAGEYKVTPNSGGLVSALLGLKSTAEFNWVGACPDIRVEDQEDVAKKLLDEYNSIPVFIDASVYSAFYDGLANSYLWPVLHQHIDYEQAFDVKQWKAYEQANSMFKDAVLNILEGSSEKKHNLFLHDYHLLLLPEMLRDSIREGPQVNIGFFLHTPFPSYDVFRSLPVHKRILRSLLQCDLIGFHIPDYLMNFQDSIRATFDPEEINVMPTSITLRDHIAKTQIFPIGIEPEQFASTTASEVCQARTHELQAQFEGMQIVISVDRLDPIKGIVHRLLGISELFKRFPEHIGKVVFLQISVPSRQSVEQYKKLTRSVNTMVASLNANWGSLTYQPVHYQYRSINNNELCALYSAGDVAMITSLIDGMNLVAFEYVACQGLTKVPGVLMISEFAGCAQSLSGGLQMNSFDPVDIAEKLHQALTFSPMQRKVRFEQLNNYVSNHTSSVWAGTFVSELERSSGRAPAPTRPLSPAAAPPPPSETATASAPSPAPTLSASEAWSAPSSVPAMMPPSPASIVNSVS
jgi:alpha,alpha-trehalose-phosphate synthase [UDP-forming]